MSQDPDTNVIVATRFSRLKDGRIGGEPASGADVGYEALSALSEAMDLLGDALKASSAGTAWDFERNEKLERRLEELLRCVERPGDAPASVAPPSGEAGEAHTQPRPESACTVRK